MVSENRRNMFRDLYRLAEYYECPPLEPGDIEGNVAWFTTAIQKQLAPFLEKYGNDQLAVELANDIVFDANSKAAVLNKMERVI